MAELRIALQSGAMKSALMDLFAGAFLPIFQENEACFDGIVDVDDWSLRVRFMKSSSIPGQVVSGESDCGITGQDVIHQAEMEGDISEITELNLARRTNRPARVVLVGMAGAKFEGVVNLYVDREYSRLARQLIESSIKAQVTLEICDGTAEEQIRTSRDFAIVATETGSSLAANGLEVIDILMESKMVLFVRKELSVSERHATVLASVEELGWLLRGTIEARPRVLLNMNVPDQDSLEEVLSALPSLMSPTESPLKEGGVALEAVIFTEMAAGILTKLKRAGATGILVQDLRMVVL